jgi:hypothetical protein
MKRRDLLRTVAAGVPGMLLAVRMSARNLHAFGSPDGPPPRVELLGGGTVHFERSGDGLKISLPGRDATRPEVLAFRIV